MPVQLTKAPCPISETLAATYRLVVNGEEFRQAMSFEELEDFLRWQAARIEARTREGWKVVS